MHSPQHSDLYTWHTASGWVGCGAFCVRSPTLVADYLETHRRSDDEVAKLLPPHDALLHRLRVTSLAIVQWDGTPGLVIASMTRRPFAVLNPLYARVIGLRPGDTVYGTGELSPIYDAVDPEGCERVIMGLSRFLDPSIEKVPIWAMEGLRG